VVIAIASVVIAIAIVVIAIAIVAVLVVVIGAVIGVNALVAQGDWIESQLWNCFVAALVAPEVLRFVTDSNYSTLWSMQWRKHQYRYV
jgi:hypothetical protein